MQLREETKEEKKEAIRKCVMRFNFWRGTPFSASGAYPALSRRVKLSTFHLIFTQTTLKMGHS